MYELLVLNDDSVWESLGYYDCSIEATNVALCVAETFFVRYDDTIKVNDNYKPYSTVR